jgi:hypothetical protein
MNANQIINMIMRVVMRRVVNKGVNMGIDGAGKLAQKARPGKKGAPSQHGTQSRDA